jgi:hypothetical protein
MVKVKSKATITVADGVGGMTKVDCEVRNLG